MKKRIGLLLLMILLFVVAGAALAASTDLDISWWTVDGGGGTSQGGDFALSGTIGQPDASEVMTGGDFALVGGYWAGVQSSPYMHWIYLPLVMR